MTGKESVVFGAFVAGAVIMLIQAGDARSAGVVLDVCCKYLQDALRMECKKHINDALGREVEQ